MDFEISILKGIKKDYENYIRENKQIHSDTKSYLKYLEHREKAVKEIKQINEQIDLFNNTEINYKNRLINFQIRDFLFSKVERTRDLEEDIRFIDSKIKTLKYELNIYKMYENYINEIHRLEIRISEIENKMNLEYEIVQV